MKGILPSALIVLTVTVASCRREPGSVQNPLMKGMAYRQPEREGTVCSDLVKSDVSWYYNRTAEPDCPPGPDLQFIPTIGNPEILEGESRGNTVDLLAGSGYAALLGYYEPNRQEGRGMTVEGALEYWPLLEKTGLRLGSPAASGRSGLDWTIEFLKGAKERGYRIDFLALNWFGNCSGTGDLDAFLEYYDAFKMPMWLIGWSCPGEDMEANAAFLEKAIPVLETYERLERYAWHGNRSSGAESRVIPLFDEKGRPTVAGRIYRDLPPVKSRDTARTGIPDLTLEIVDWHAGPVLGKGDPGTEEIKHGFEGGRVIKQDGWYHLFTSEQAGDPKWTKMRLAHWKSRDGIAWQRVSTLYESSGDYTGEDPRAALWSPMPVFNGEDSTWYMTYVAYRSMPNTREQFLNNFGGRIVQARSVVGGRKGLGGPYRDVAVIQEPGPLADEWEGLQGSDSFFPFKAGNKWLAFTGSAKTEKLPMEFWGNGLALSPSLTGPWIRLSNRSPVDFGTNFSENPIVTELPDGTLVAVMDSHGSGFGYSISVNGVDWSHMKFVEVTDKLDKWWAEFRTPLGLVPEQDGTYTLFFTVMKEPTDYWDHLGEEGYVLDTGFDSVGKMTIRINR